MTDGIYFTSLMLAMGAGEIFIGYVTAALTFCGFFQFFSPLILSRFPRRKNLPRTCAMNSSHCRCSRNR